MDLESQHVGKKFGFCRVVWEIKNYCSPPSLEDYNFQSPEFYIKGIHLTKWKMLLRRTFVSEENYTLRLQLTRLECGSAFEPVWVDCVIEYSDDLEEPIELDFQYNFVIGTTYAQELKFDPVPESFYHSVVFKLQCEILVSFMGVEEIVLPCKDEAVRKLSNDLHHLFHNDVYYDFAFQYASGIKSAHKAILYYRITDERYKNEIANFDAVNFEDFDKEPINQVLLFLYTGNIEHAVRRPRIFLFKVAEILCVQPIIAYYNPDEIIMTSDVEVEEYKITWDIENFLNINENYVVSPLTTNGLMDTEWCLKVYPNGFGRKQKYVGIFFEIETRVKKVICVDIFLWDAEVHFYRKHKTVEGKEVFGNKNFIERQRLINNMPGDSLSIGLKLRITTGEENCSLCESNSGFEHISEEMNYDRFSKDILCIFNEGKFHDWNFKELNMALKLHKCILSVRYVSLYQAFTEDLSSLEKISNTVLKEIFSFLYSGKLNSGIVFEDFVSLYDVAKKFTVTTLMYSVVNMLKESISESNAREIYKFANLRDIQDLKKAALNYMEDLG